jgi:hypothetical protein
MEHARVLGDKIGAAGVQKDLIKHFGGSDSWLIGRAIRELRRLPA